MRKLLLSALDEISHDVGARLVLFRQLIPQKEYETIAGVMVSSFIECKVDGHDDVAFVGVRRKGQWQSACVHRMELPERLVHADDEVLELLRSTPPAVSAPASVPGHAELARDVGTRWAILLVHEPDGEHCFVGTVIEETGELVSLPYGKAPSTGGLTMAHAHRIAAVGGGSDRGKRKSRIH